MVYVQTIRLYTLTTHSYIPKLFPNKVGGQDSHLATSRCGQAVWPRVRTQPEEIGEALATLFFLFSPFPWEFRVQKSPFTKSTHFRIEGTSNLHRPSNRPRFLGCPGH